MAQSGFTPIQIYYSTTSGNTPLAADLANGELAINTNDGILYYKDSGGVVQVLASGSSVSVSAALVATTANITLSGAQTIDGVSVVAGNRVLVKDQTLSQNNGLYVASAGAWTRAIDANSSAEIAGRIISVQSGSTNGGEQYATTFKSTDTLGTTAMAWFQVALQNTAVTFTDLTTTGNMVFGNADTDTITQAASYVTGTQLKSAKVATDTLTLAAYDVDGAAYTNLITLTASNTPTLALTSTGVGTINNMSIGATTASTGAFTTLSATGDITGNGNWTIGNADTDTINQGASYVAGTQLKSAKVATNTLNLAAYDVDGAAYTNLITLTASNTPTLALTSTGTGTINNMSIGATTTSTGAFTTLSATGNVTLGDASADTVTVNGTSTFTAKPTVQLTSAATNTVTQAIRLDSQSSGTPANGIGVGMEFAVETTAGNTEIGATINAVTTDVTAASEDFDLVFNTMAGGATVSEGLRVKNTGGITIPTGGTYQINSVSVLSATTLGTSVVSSSLTSVGTIGTGVWQGTVIGATYGGTGVNNSTRTLTISTNGGTIAFPSASTTMTFPSSTATLAGLGIAQTFSAAQTFSSTVTMSGTTTNIDIGTSQSSGTLTMGGATGTGIITLGRSTDAQTINIGTGANSVATKTINIGTGSTGGSTSINIGSTAGTSTTTVNGNFAAGVINSTRINPRVSSAASAASVTPDVSVGDIYAFTALAVGLTINAPTGTPTDGAKLIFRILDNGTTRTLTWNATYTAIGVTIPTATLANKTIYVGCIYNANNTRWDVIASAIQA